MQNELAKLKSAYCLHVWDQKTLETKDGCRTGGGLSRRASQNRETTVLGSSSLPVKLQHAFSFFHWNQPPHPLSRYWMCRRGKALQANVTKKVLKGTVSHSAGADGKSLEICAQSFCERSRLRIGKIDSLDISWVMRGSWVKLLCWKYCWCWCCEKLVGNDWVRKGFVKRLDGKMLI